jgi:predicted MPP superfamily phosphohydrolase
LVVSAKSWYATDFRAIAMGGPSYGLPSFMTIALVWTALALAALGHGFLWSALVNRIHAWGGPRRVIKLLTILCGLALIGLPALILLRTWPAGISTFNPFDSPLVIRGYLIACTAIGTGSLILKPWIEAKRCDPTVLKSWSYDRRDISKALGRKPLVGALAKTLGALPGNECLTLSIDRKQLALPRLPAELRGLTIAHLSDLHMTGRLDCDFFSYVARQVNDLRPDVIAITGDIIEEHSCRPWLEETLGQLCAPLGVYFILGNHDSFIDTNETRKALVNSGLTSLTGRWLKADWNGAAVTLGGNELPWTGPAAPLDELPLRNPEAPEFRLVLCHTPDQFRWCQRADADLALAGHTHGGQVQLPLLGVVASPSAYGTRYACGVFRRGNTVMHVTRGVGGETPLRWRCPPELALLELIGDE